MDSFLLGLSLKLVDEVIDKDVEVQPLYLELFKCLSRMVEGPDGIINKKKCAC